MSNHGELFNANSQFVLTPGGLRPKRRVHIVSATETVIGDKSNPFLINNLKTIPSSFNTKSRALSGNQVLTPGGFRNPALVHQVDPENAVHIIDGDLHLLNLTTKASVAIPKVDLKAEDVPHLGTGWIAYTYWNNTTGKPITSFRTTWTVPPPPSTCNSQTIFLFNGIDPINPSAGILQPVLQWGISAAGGGKYWTVASWYVSESGHAFHTPLVTVNVGDTLIGKMTLTGSSGGLHDYLCEFQNVAGTSLPVKNLPELVWCNETLEAYSANQCSDYPNVDLTAFRMIQVATGAESPSIQWTAVNQVTDCGQGAVVLSNSAIDGAVDIFYRNHEQPQFHVTQLAENMQILFGVTNDGDEIIVLPDGHIVRIPVRQSSETILNELVEGVRQIISAIAIHEVGKNSRDANMSKAIGNASLKAIRDALEKSLRALNEGM